MDQQRRRLDRTGARSPPPGRGGGRKTPAESALARGGRSRLAASVLEGERPCGGGTVFLRSAYRRRAPHRSRRQSAWDSSDLPGYILATAANRLSTSLSGKWTTPAGLPRRRRHMWPRARSSQRAGGPTCSSGGGGSWMTGPRVSRAAAGAPSPPDPLIGFHLVRRRTDVGYHGRKSLKFNGDCTICRSCRNTQSESAVPKKRENGSKWRIRVRASPPGTGSPCSGVRGATASHCMREPPPQGNRSAGSLRQPRRSHDG